MRIIHLEDEWAKTKAIPTSLHDRMFRMLRIEDAMKIKREVYRHDNGDGIRWKISVHSDTASDKNLIFDYLFIEDAAYIERILSNDNNYIIVDIMRRGEGNRFVDIISELTRVRKEISVPPENWRYFSAFPQNIPKEINLDGWPKENDKELLDFLLDKVTERLKCLGITPQMAIKS